jgi:hypothetical protein
MTLTDEQIEYIATNLEFYGVASEDLKDDLLDHICTHIETGTYDDFDLAYKEALHKIGGYAAVSKLERDRYMLLNFRSNIRRQKIIYFLGFIATFTALLGVLFKIMHWPGASVLIFSGCTIFLIGYLPLYFYQRYRLFNQKAIS